MRQELWMTEGDGCAMVEFPEVTRVWGIHQNKIYRSLECRDYMHYVHIRRLQSSAMLRQPRSEILKTAPRLWPKIDESGRLVEEGVSSTDNFPLHHNEEHRDTWDGDARLIWDEWLWEGVDTGACDVGKGIGALIVGADGSIWGTVVADEGHVWKLDSGRVAKKATEGSKWRWAEGGIGYTIIGADGSAWGKVVADEGNAWKLESGRVAKKETEGVKWWWADGNWEDAGGWENASGWDSWSGGWQESHGGKSSSGKGRRS